MGIPSRERHLKSLIRSRYARRVAQGNCAPGGRPGVLGAGYHKASLNGVPIEAIERWSGCGNLGEQVKVAPGGTVVDLGCGGGLDLWILFTRNAPSVRLVGIDLTAQMLTRRPHGPHFIVGDMEAVPLDAASCDLVIANSSFNLAVDLNRALGEAARILRPGGQLHFWDLVLEEELPAELLSDPLGHGTSLGGVRSEAGLLDALAIAGFRDAAVCQSRPFSPVLAVEIVARR